MLLFRSPNKLPGYMTMKNLSSRLRVLGFAVLACLASAPAMSQPAGSGSLYQALGSQPGVHALSEAFAAQLTADARVSEGFKETNMKRFKQKLEEQICQVSGGPCSYTGDPMYEVHKGLKVTAAGFNAVVEDLQKAMEVLSIPFATQNALLALLAPMHREIVAKPTAN